MTTLCKQCKVPLERDIKIAANSHFWVGVANPENSFTAMFILRVLEALASFDGQKSVTSAALLDV